jgi:dGTPase
VTLPDSALAAYAADERQSRGRAFDESAPNHRSQYQRDRDRVVHCSAFRRLEYKTQVFVNHEGDMFRNRLTHSVEVAQIARTAARVLRLNEDLTEAICLAHDLGHTPFGHAGQDALNDCMRAYGGFEHNLQSLRVVELLEYKYADFDGLNLMFETREGILKHCSLPNARKLGAIGERFLNRTQPGLEAQLANVADEIAYNNHDVDDGLRAGLISVEQLCEIRMFGRAYDEVIARWPGLERRRVVHEVIRRMIGRQVEDLLDATSAAVANLQPQSVDEVRGAPNALVCMSEAGREDHLELKRFLREALYRHYRVHRMTVKAGRTVKALFDAFMDDIRVLPPGAQARARELGADGDDTGKARAVADYIAGMTDRFAISEYQRLYAMAELT